MLDIQTYLNSGIIEDYCLAQVSPQQATELERYCVEYPAVKQALEKAQDLLIAFVGDYQRPAPTRSKQFILRQIATAPLQNLKRSATTNQIDTFIGVSEHSDLAQWQKLTEGLTPPEDYDIHLHKLFGDDTNRLFVGWIRQEVPEEVHDALDEQFLLLEGSCICRVGTAYINMKPGDYLRIPLHVIHDLQVTSDHPVKIILTKRKVA